MGVGRNIIAELGQRGVILAASYLENRGGSQTLANDISFQVESETQGVIYVPHYWAHYVHDGRASISMPPGKYLIFFPNKGDDPRTQGGTRYPTRYAQARARRLSHDEFREFQLVNRQRALAGLPPIMIVTRDVGPVKSIPFFGMGLKPLIAAARILAGRQLSLEIQQRGFTARKSLVGKAKIG